MGEPAEHVPPRPTQAATRPPGPETTYQRNVLRDAMPGGVIIISDVEDVRCDTAYAAVGRGLLVLRMGGLGQGSGVGSWRACERRLLPRW